MGKKTEKPGIVIMRPLTAAEAGAGNVISKKIENMLDKAWTDKCITALIKIGSSPCHVDTDGDSFSYVPVETAASRKSGNSLKRCKYMKKFGEYEAEIKVTAGGNKAEAAISLSHKKLREFKAVLDDSSPVESSDRQVVFSEIKPGNHVVKLLDSKGKFIGRITLKLVK